MPRAPAPTSSSDRASSSALVRHTTELSSDEYLQNSKACDFRQLTPQS